ncbi:DNA cytosine methyltransferase [Nocardia sp. CDC160]|uniref:DNA cytosine methyltransferase n=1 Tax=Nocardia sp. CDC160 TaxID=3112166 RepID=UPI002DBDCAF0|nr:DNA (cytosine-5-)-methyltransferase [Nocardia sp. CDC160]MEC3920279.1 DNA (cytosine-5-)-methyltransferase [Nocardia sp. CDC160]
MAVAEEFLSVEICAGAGGQAAGLHRAGFRHLALVELDEHAAQTLRLNIANPEGRPPRSGSWERCDVLAMDVKDFDPTRDLAWGAELLAQRGLDLLAGGVPCPPFSHAGKQLGREDERDLFPRMLELVELLRPRAVMIENVRGIMDPKFAGYRDWIISKLQGGPYFADDGQIGEEPGLGYTVCRWDVLEASDFGVPQLRPRAILVAFRDDVIADLDYVWPEPTHRVAVTVADALEASMRVRFEPYFVGEHSDRAHAAFNRWRERSCAGVAPTLVGGSKKHGGADLGPTRAKAAWKQLGICGLGVANDAVTCRQKQTEERDLFGADGPMLTVEQAATIQGFPAGWVFSGAKTAQYRQVGNAFPPPVATAVGESIIAVLRAARERDQVTADTAQRVPAERELASRTAVTA